MVNTMLPLHRAQVRSLVGELKSCMLQDLKIIIIPSYRSVNKCLFFFFLNFWLHRGTPLQYSCLETPMDGGAWWAAVHGVAESRTRLSDFTFTFHFHALEKEMATPVFLPGESQGWGSLVGFRLWGRTESDTTEAT